MSSPTPLRRELLASLGILFGGVTLLLGIAISLVLPFLRSTGEATVFILIIVAVDLVIVLTFGGWALKKNLLEPMDELVLVLCSQSLFRFTDLGDDGLCRGGPDKGCGVIVSAIDVVVDRLD